VDAANMLATAEVSPSLHDSSTSIKAVSPPIGSLHRRPDLMTQRLFKEIAGKSGIFSPGPKRSLQSVWRDWATALGIPHTTT
jgi:hypothetical protein